MLSLQCNICKYFVDLPGPWENPVNEYREFEVVKDTREWKDVKKDFDTTINREGVTLIQVSETLFLAFTISDNVGASYSLDSRPLDLAQKRLAR